MNKETRIVTLDGLRGIAVLLVISFHYLNNQYASMDITRLNGIQKAVMKATYFGWCGVDLFFVLSGFLIGSILLKASKTENFFKTFYIRRFFRIIPIYYLLLILFIILKYSPLFVPDAYIFEKPLPIGYYFLFIQNFLMGAHNHFGPEALTPTWSLAVEEQFYLIIPLIVYLAKPKQVIFIALFLICLAPICRSLTTNWYQKYTLLSSRIDSPAFGLLLACLLHDQRSRTFIINNMTRIKGISIPVFVISAVLYGSSRVGVFNHSILALNFTLIIMIATFLTRGWGYRLLTSRFLVITGGLSYFLYLYHQVFNGAFHLAFIKQKMPQLDSPYAYGVTAFALLTVYCLAQLSYKYVEQPLIRYSHTYKYRSSLA